jgi:hypothetical protein
VKITVGFKAEHASHMIVVVYRKLGDTTKMNTRELPNGSSIFKPSLKSQNP